MEDTFRAKKKSAKRNESKSLNPYFSGRYVPRMQRFLGGKGKLLCLNPYFSGRYVPRPAPFWRISQHYKVLILISVEDTFRGSLPGCSSRFNSRLNPYFSGRYVPRPAPFWRISQHYKVLILIPVEDTLRGGVKRREKFPRLCLNPYSSGRDSPSHCW